MIGIWIILVRSWKLKYFCFWRCQDFWWAGGMCPWRLFRLRGCDTPQLVHQSSSPGGCATLVVNVVYLQPALQPSDHISNSLVHHPSHQHLPPHRDLYHCSTISLWLPELLSFNMSAMSVFWAAPPIARTLAAAAFTTSILVYLDFMSANWIVFAPYMVWRFPPEIWRFVSAFLLTGPDLGIIFDTYFRKNYLKIS